MAMVRTIHVDAKTGKKEYRMKNIVSKPFVKQVLKSQAEKLAETLKAKGVITQADVDEVKS